MALICTRMSFINYSDFFCFFLPKSVLSQSPPPPPPPSPPHHHYHHSSSELLRLQEWSWVFLFPSIYTIQQIFAGNQVLFITAMHITYYWIFTTSYNYNWSHKIAQNDLHLVFFHIFCNCLSVFSRHTIVFSFTTFS